MCFMIGLFIGSTNLEDAYNIGKIFSAQIRTAKPCDARRILENESVEIILFTDFTPKRDELKHYKELVKCLNEEQLVLVNNDNNGFTELLLGVRCRIVTYGFNSRASITASSIGRENEDGLLCCLQRSLMCSDGKIIEPGEFKMNALNDVKKIEPILAVSAFAIAGGLLL